MLPKYNTLAIPSSHSDYSLTDSSFTGLHFNPQGNRPFHAISPSRSQSSQPNTPREAMNAPLTGKEQLDVKKSASKSPAANLKKFSIKQQNLVTPSKRQAHSPLQGAIRSRPERTQMDHSMSNSSEELKLPTNSAETRLRAFQAKMQATALQMEHMFASMNLSSSDDSAQSSWDGRAHFVAQRSTSMVGLISGNQYDAVRTPEKKRDPLAQNSDDDCIFHFCPEPDTPATSNEYQSFSALKFNRAPRA